MKEKNNNKETKTLEVLCMDVPLNPCGRSSEWACQLSEEILPGLHEYKDQRLISYAAGCAYKAGIAVATATLRDGVEAGEHAYQTTLADAKESCLADIENIFDECRQLDEFLDWEADKNERLAAAAFAAATEAAKSLDQTTCSQCPPP